MTAILLTSFIYLAWWSWLTLWWSNATTSERMVGAFVLTVTQITAVGIGLGMIGWFNWILLFTGNLLIGILVLKCSVPGDLFSEFRRIRDVLRIAFKSDFTGIVTVLAMVVLGVAAWLAFRLPPMAYDVYHLVKAALLVQTGHIQPWGWDGRGVDFYPANLEMIQAYVLALSNGTSLVCLIQLVFGLALSVMIYRVCRNFGCRHSHAIAVGLMMWACIPVWAESWHALSDLAVAGMVGIGWGLLTGRKVGSYEIILSGLAWGWAVGCKLSSLYWLIGALIYYTWRVLNEKSNGS
jgi:hypothetical protein